MVKGLVIFLGLILFIYLAIFLLGEVIIDLTIESANHCKVNEDCFIFFNNPHAVCGEFIHIQEKARMLKLIKFIESVNPYFARRKTVRCGKNSLMGSKSLCKNKRCIRVFDETIGY